MPPMAVLGIELFAGPSLAAPGPSAVVRLEGGGATVRLPSHRQLPQLGDFPTSTAAEAVAWLGAALQQALGHAPSAARAGRDWAVVPLWDRDVGALAVRTAATAVRRAAAGEPALFRAVLDRFFARAAVIDHSESARRLLLRAAARGIPWARLLPGRAGLRLGIGCRQRRLIGSYTPGTSFQAAQLATHKDQAAALLRRQGLPVPANGRADSLEEALRLAGEIGFPVVVKPVATDFGTAVVTGIVDADGLRRAYAAAARHGPVLVERQIAGDNVRLLVLHGRFVSAVRQEPAAVVGDGVATVAALVDRVNAGRTAALSSSFKRIALDAEADVLLGRQGLERGAVPAAGRRVVLRHTSNTSRGGTARNVTAEVHPDNRRLAERAAQVVGLDGAGIDFITPDIGRSFREVGGAICEINPGPGLYMREPEGVIEDALLDGLFPAGSRGRIPIVCLLAAEGPVADAVFDDLVRRLGAATAALAVARRGEVRIGDWPVAGPTAPAGARIALDDPATSALAVLLTRRAVAAEGLPFDACDLALVAPGGPAPDPVGDLLAGVARRTVAAADRRRVADAVDRLIAERSPDGL